MYTLQYLVKQNIAKETDTYIEVNDVFTKLECDKKIASGNMFGFTSINHFTRNYSQGDIFITLSFPILAGSHSISIGDIPR